MKHRIVLASLAVMAAAGCGSTEPTSSDVAFAPLASAGAQSPAVTGGGTFDLTAAGAGFTDFTYSVRATATGANGSFRQVRFAEGLVIDFDGEATCVAIDPVNHRAWVAGVITANRSTHPAFLVDTLHLPGMAIWFRTVDYGEGSGAQPDRSTVFGFRGSAGIQTSPEYCATRPWPDADARTWPVSAGNIQVH